VGSRFGGLERIMNRLLAHPWEGSGLGCGEDVIRRVLHDQKGIE
jgi:hypothetical protein